MKNWIYLDDIRTPDDSRWIVVKTYSDFIDKVDSIGLENIEIISLDHDLDRSAMREWLNNTTVNYTINYDNITEKTGMDCAKWLVEKWSNGEPVCEVKVHSANAIGSGNIMGYINNYKHINGLTQDCTRWVVPYSQG